MMKLQKIILCGAVAAAACGASLGLLELGNYVRAALLAPHSAAELGSVRQTPAPPTIVPPGAEFKLPANEIEPAEEPVYEWSETGDYYIAGKNPKGFENFDSLMIVTREWDEKTERLVPVKPYGALHTARGSDSQEYEFSAVNINGKRISIVTREFIEISYQFDGKFVEEKVNYDAGAAALDTQLVLKGRLTKWRGGKKIAEAIVKLVVGGC